MSSTGKKILAGIILFASGLVVGFFGARLWTERTTMAIFHGNFHRFADMALARMSADLNLTKEQQDQLRPVFRATAKKMAEIRREQEPKIQAAIESDMKAVRKVLTPEQTVKFEAILKRLRERRKALDRFGPPPPPPPGGPMGPPPDGPPPDGPPPDGPDGPMGPPPDGFGGPHAHQGHWSSPQDAKPPADEHTAL